MFGPTNSPLSTKRYCALSKPCSPIKKKRCGRADLHCTKMANGPSPSRVEPVLRFGTRKPSVMNGDAHFHGVGCHVCLVDVLEADRVVGDAGLIAELAPEVKV